MIDVAERIFVRIAEAMISQDRTSIREVFRENIFSADLEGQVIELLQPIGLIEGIKDLGIDDLTEKEIHYVLRVLTKPELDGAIVFDELLKIMENLGLYEDEDGMDEDGMDGDMDMDGEEEEDVGARAGEGEQEAASQESPSDKPRRKKNEPLDLSRLDQKSVKIMVMLMVNLIQAEMTTQEFFADVIFRQNVKTKTKHFTMEFIQAEDFFRVIKQRGIRSKDTEHPNLREFLQLNADNPSLLLVKNIRKTLE